MKADLQLQQDVAAELKWEPAVHNEQIGVEVKNGVVTLASEVEWQYQRQDAADSVRYLLGVAGSATRSQSILRCRPRLSSPTSKPRSGVARPPMQRPSPSKSRVAM
jgi:hypothetical protein